MIERLTTNFGALTAEDRFIFDKRFAFQTSQYTRDCMRNGEFEDARIMNEKVKGGSHLAASEETTSHRDRRL